MIYVGDIGVTLQYTILNLSPSQLAAITAQQFTIQDPVGVSRVVAATLIGSILQYQTTALDCTKAGWYWVLPQVTMTGGVTKKLDIAGFQVQDPAVVMTSN